MDANLETTTHRAHRRDILRQVHKKPSLGL
jgi:hypothetical protein